MVHNRENGKATVDSAVRFETIKNFTAASTVDFIVLERKYGSMDLLLELLLVLLLFLLLYVCYPVHLGGREASPA